MRLISDELAMPSLGRRRKVWFLLPSSYDRRRKAAWPVLYMQDGHNLFDPATATFGETWRIPETLTALEEAGQPWEGIVIGVDCNHEGEKRLDEYSPWVNRDIGKLLPRTRGITSAGGEGASYLGFLTDTLLPWAEEVLGASHGPAGAMIAGSSMGAVMALYAGLSRPDLFGVIGAFSPAAWFAKKELMDFVQGHSKELAKAWPAVYIDVGTEETSDAAKTDFPSIYERDARELSKALLEAGLPERKGRLVVEEGADHSERSWARRFPGFLEWARGSGALDRRSATISP